MEKLNDKDFFKALERVLGRRELELLMKQVHIKAAVVERAREVVKNGVEAFLKFAESVDDKIIDGLGAKAVLEANRGLGCPEPLAKAEALVKALAKYLSREEARRLGEIEIKLWKLAVQQCATLAAAAAGQVYTVEEV